MVMPDICISHGMEKMVPCLCTYMCIDEGISVCVCVEYCKLPKKSIVASTRNVYLIISSNCFGLGKALCIVLWL